MLPSAWPRPWSLRRRASPSFSHPPPPERRVAGAGLRLDVVPPHVLRALAVGPDVLAGDRARMAADALVEVEAHRALRADVQRASSVPAGRHHSSLSSLRTTA